MMKTASCFYAIENGNKERVCVCIPSTADVWDYMARHFPHACEKNPGMSLEAIDGEPQGIPEVTRDSDLVDFFCPVGEVVARHIEQTKAMVMLDYLVREHWDELEALLPTSYYEGNISFLMTSIFQNGIRAVKSASDSASKRCE